MAKSTTKADWLRAMREKEYDENIRAENKEERKTKKGRPRKDTNATETRETS